MVLRDQDKIQNNIHNGTGAIALELRKKGGQVDCFELNKDRAELLKGLGFKTANIDFLKVSPNPIYDIVALNPPFDNGRDCDQVTHALKFLKPGGRLVSVMSARAEFSQNKRHLAFRSLLKRDLSIRSVYLFEVKDLAFLLPVKSYYLSILGFQSLFVVLLDVISDF